MKIVTVIFSLFLISSCGRVEVSSTNGLGDFKSLNSITIDQNQLSTISSICQSLTRKNSALPALVNTPYVFSYSTKKCNETGMSAASDVATTLQTMGTSYKFLQGNGSSFYFGEVETPTSGSLSRICQQMADTGSLTNPSVAGTEVLFINPGVVGGDCPPAANESCLLLEKGTNDGNGLAKIHTKEWIRFNLKINSGKDGFFTYQKQVTSQGCSEGAFSVNQAVLK